MELLLLQDFMANFRQALHLQPKHWLDPGSISKGWEGRVQQFAQAQNPGVSYQEMFVYEATENTRLD